jgi:hypothetical protein
VCVCSLWLPRYEKLTAGVEEENLGPLEATINNLTKQIAAKTEASDALQRQWLQDQTMLVEAANNLEMKTEKVLRGRVGREVGPCCDMTVACRPTT